MQILRVKNCSQMHGISYRKAIFYYRLYYWISETKHEAMSSKFISIYYFLRVGVYRPLHKSIFSRFDFCDRQICTQLSVLYLGWLRHYFFSPFSISFFVLLITLALIYRFRYFAVTQVQYIHSRTTRTIGSMIGMIWLTSIIVSLAPLFGWKDEDSETRVEEHKLCLVRSLAVGKDYRK